MITKPIRLLLQVGGVLAAFLLQIGIVYLNWYLKGLVARTFQRNLNTLSVAILILLLGLASGIVLALLLVPAARSRSAGAWFWVRGLILGIVPAVAVILELLFWAGVPLMFPHRAVHEWIFGSEVPALWLGLVIGWGLKGRWLPARQEGA